MKHIPLHIIVQELASISWNKLPEGYLRDIYTYLEHINTEHELKVLIIPGYVKANIHAVFSDIKITYQLEKVGLNLYRIVLDEVFLGDNVITNLLSEKAIADIMHEAEAILERTTLEIVSKEDYQA